MTLPVGNTPPDGSSARAGDRHGKTRPRGIVLMNRASGRTRTGDEARRIEALIRDRGDLALRILDPGDMKGAVEEAVAQGHEMVVAAGGDGTVSLVCGILAGNRAKLGVLPLGTFNFFARSLGIPQDIETALDVLGNGRDRPIALGRINDCVFINNASIGAYAAVLEARETIYERWGRSRLAAYWSVIVAMLTLYRSLKMTITADGERRQARAPLAFFAVRAYQAREYGLSGPEEIEAGKLALYLAPDTNRAVLLWRTLKILLRRVEPGADYRLITGREIVVETAYPRQTVAHDGERDVMESPFRVCRVPDAITVVVPADAGEPR